MPAPIITTQADMIAVMRDALGQIARNRKDCGKPSLTRHAEQSPRRDRRSRIPELDRERVRQDPSEGAGMKLLRPSDFQTPRAYRRWVTRHFNSRRRHGDTCPACAQARVVHLMTREDGVPLDACMSCHVMWEREVRERPVCERCEGCAFSPGSPEQADKEHWRQIIAETVKSGGTFYCHKRVPFVISDDGMVYQHEVDGSRCTNATECAGWLEARLSYLQKDLPA